MSTSSPSLYLPVAVQFKPGGRAGASLGPPGSTAADPDVAGSDDELYFSDDEAEQHYLRQVRH